MVHSLRSPSRDAHSTISADGVGEKVGGSKVDKFGVRIVMENLPGGHWIDRHNAMEQEVASLCAYAGLPAEREHFGLFGHLLPQQALTCLQQHQRSQVLLPDLRMDIPPVKVRAPAPRSGSRPGGSSCTPCPRLHRVQ